MRRFVLTIVIVSSFTASYCQAAPPAKTATDGKPELPATNSDEALVPPYTLPDPLKFSDGTPVATPRDWFERRRPELLGQFTHEMFGKSPPAPKQTQFQVIAERPDALGGRATRKQVEITLADGPQPLKMTMLLYVPKGVPAAPVFWGLNFGGNQTTTTEPDVPINPGWMHDWLPGVMEHRATEESRGKAAGQWPIELIVGRGYALATAYYGDIEPDFDDAADDPIHLAYRRPGQTEPADDDWGAIAAWAWGLSRGLDYLEHEPLVDAHRVAVIGHSRLGKTALWAGATDPRFALVVSNDSGCGGAALSKRFFGETVARINLAFPHWFCGNFQKYNDNEAALPLDQHELLALIAPRPLYVASASEDSWADPKGEFLAAVAADPVYRLLGSDGFGGAVPPAEMPAADQPLSTGTIGYHLRSGKHAITPWDWQQYLDFADRHLEPGGK